MLGRAHKNRSNHKGPQVLALALIGAGLLVLGVVALVLLPRPAGAGEESSSVPVEVSFPAPELSLLDLQGNAVSLAGARGQWVLVNNWATWCPPCKAEMPTLKAFYNEHRRQNFTLVAIEAGEPAEEVDRFVRSYGLPFPVWLDPGQEAMTAFHNEALPSSYLIDPQGNVRLAWSGAISRKMLEKTITPLLEE